MIYSNGTRKDQQSIGVYVVKGVPYVKWPPKTQQFYCFDAKIFTFYYISRINLNEVALWFCLCSKRYNKLNGAEY